MERLLSSAEASVKNSNTHHFKANSHDAICSNDL